MERDPELPAPLYSPRLVAHSILSCAERPVDSLFVGGSGFLFSLLQKFTPKLSEWVNRAEMFEQQKSKKPKSRAPSLMRSAKDEARVFGDSSHKMKTKSLTTQVLLHPWVSGLTAALVGALLLKLRSPLVQKFS